MLIYSLLEAMGLCPLLIQLTNRETARKQAILEKGVSGMRSSHRHLLAGTAIAFVLSSCGDAATIDTSQGSATTVIISTSSTSITTSKPSARICASDRWRFEVPADWYSNVQPSGSTIVNCRFLRFKVPSSELNGDSYTIEPGSETPNDAIGIDYFESDPSRGPFGGTLQLIMADLGIADANPKFVDDRIVFEKNLPPTVNVSTLARSDLTSGGTAVVVVGTRPRDGAKINRLLLSNREGNRLASIGGSNNPATTKPPLPTDAELTAAMLHVGKSFEFIK
jgi:hypothetical protein